VIYSEERVHFTFEIFKRLERELSSKCNTRFLYTHNFEKVINPRYAKKVPIHRWYILKESYSPYLIEELVKAKVVRMPTKGVLDPFVGAGSTLLGSQWIGTPSIGVDIVPFFCLVSKVKTLWKSYNIKVLKEIYEKVRRLDVEKEPNLGFPTLSTFSRVYDARILRELLVIKEFILDLNKDLELYKDLLKVVLASILEPTSRAKKNGKGLKIVRKGPLEKPKNAFLRKLEEVINDLSVVHYFLRPKYASAKVLNDDARQLGKVPKGETDLVVFSPPYLNTFDYTEVYKLELWFLDFVKSRNEWYELRRKTFRSHNLAKWARTEYWSHEVLNKIEDYLRKQELWCEEIPIIVRGYFDDMYLTLKALYEVTYDECCVVIIVGNSAYGGIIIPVDLLIMRSALEVGFIPEKLLIVRELGTSSQQLRLLRRDMRKLLRESIIVLRKR